MSILAFESPVAAVYSFEPGHSNPHTIFEMAPTGTRRNPAPAPPAAQAPAVDAVTPSPTQAPLETRCMCGAQHTAIPHWKTGVEVVRLVEVFVSNPARDAVSRIGSGRTRDTMGANLEDPWNVLAHLYKDPVINPCNVLPNETGLDVVDPESLEFCHTRRPCKLKDKWKELVKNLTVCVSDYEKSGQNDPDKKKDSVPNKDPCIMYCWLRLEKAQMLKEFAVFTQQYSA